MFELVYADMYGQSKIPSMIYKHYFIIFVDDYTRIVWHYFLEQQSDAYTTFLHFKALTEKQSGYQMKTLSTYSE